MTWGCRALSPYESKQYTMSDVEDSLSPQYPGDDTRPTSNREIAAWYSYGWAAEVFVVCAMGKLRPDHGEQD